MKNQIRFRISIMLLSLMAFFAGSLYAAEDIWIDVRTDQEWNSGHLEGAVHIPYTEIGEKIINVTDDKNAPIKLYCRSGGRAGKAKETLDAMGYTNVTNIGGLDDARKAAGKE